MLCESAVLPDKQTSVRLAGCGHTAHFECFLTANLVRRVMSCPLCVPDQEIKDDFGDCINMAERQLDDFTRRNMEAAAGMRGNEYSMTDIIAHATEIALVDSATDADRTFAVVSTITSSPMPPLRTWIPDMTSEKIAIVRGMLSAHANVRQLRQNGVGKLAILNSRVVLDDLLAWNYTLSEIRDMGFDFRGLVTLGFRAAHLNNAAAVSAYDMCNIFTCTFEDVLQTEQKYLTPYGALISYVTVKIGLAGHRILKLPSLEALRAHGLDRHALLVFSKTLTFNELRMLGLDGAMLRDFEMLNVADLQELGALDAVASHADITKVATTMQVPPTDIRQPVTAATITAPAPIECPLQARVRAVAPPPRSPVVATHPYSAILGRVLADTGR